MTSSEKDLKPTKADLPTPGPGSEPVAPPRFARGTEDNVAEVALVAAHYRVMHTREASSAALDKVVAGSKSMIEVMKRVKELCDWSLSGATPTVLLAGARGTGKHLLAKALHYNGARKERAYVEISCSAHTPDALRLELFGDTTRMGLLEIAHGGSIFLDEIDAVPLGIQRDLLTAIEGKQLTRAGSEETIAIDVQFLAGTRVDLEAIVKRSEFRPDLYHRLSVRTLALPALRERGTDIVAIAQVLLAELAATYRMHAPTFHEDAALALTHYTWPGNLHELRNELEHVLIHTNEPELRASHFRFMRGSGAVAIENGRHLAVTISGDGCPLEKLEREVIRQALQRCNGNVSRAARYLSVTRQTLLYRIKKYGLRVALPEDR